MYKYIDSRFRKVEMQLANQAVQNQKTADSFQIVNERMDCCCNTLNDKIACEHNERKCADNTLVNYMNSVFYPKMTANVTTGTTITAQPVFNPLPAQNCNCSCN